ncbi:MAG: uroporphyrinogen decarboxylase [Polyangiales bacterium]
MQTPKRKLLLRALSGETTERPPVWLMRQAGRYLPEYQRVRDDAGGMLGLCNSPAHAVEVALQPVRRFALDASIVFADLPQIAAALGQELTYQEGDGPVLSPPIRSAADVAQRLSLQHVHAALAPIYETIGRLAKALPPEVALIGYAGAPFTVATYMVEGRSQGGLAAHAQIKRWAFSDPEGFESLIALITAATIEYLDRQIQAGAEAIQLFETWAGILPAPYFARWCIEPVATIIEALRRKHPHVPFIAFPRGAGLLYNGYLEATKADALGLDTTVPLDWAVTRAQRTLGRCVQGNLDPHLLVVGGPAMRNETDRILSALSRGPFIFNLGHGIDKHTPPEHVTDLVQHIHAWSAGRPGA